MLPAEWFVTLLIVTQHGKYFSTFSSYIFSIKNFFKKVSALAKISARAHDKPAFFFKWPKQKVNVILSTLV